MNNESPRKNLPGDQSGESGGSGTDSSSDSAVDTVQSVSTPKMYKVLLLNDDFTPMDFVVAVLRRFFGQSEQSATLVMMDVHKKGSGVAGVFILEVAEMKVMQVHQYARMNQHPLKCSIEPA